MISFLKSIYLYVIGSLFCVYIILYWKIKVNKYNTSMKKYIVYITWTIILISMIGLMFFWFKWKGIFSQLAKQQAKVDDNVWYIVKYLEQQYKDNYPYPKWDMILMDKSFHQIHLQDYSKPIESIDKVYVIQWNLCQLDIDSVEFDIRKYDTRYSTWENIKCFSYSVLKDRTWFQIWSIKTSWDKIVAKLDGNIKYSITKDFQSTNMVIDWWYQYLPYAPFYNTKIKLKLLEWESKLSINTAIWPLILPDWYEEFIKWEWLDIPRNETQLRDYNISFEWKQFLYKLIYPNGNIMIIAPSRSGKAEVTINSFDYDWIYSQTSVWDTVWKVVYSLVKMSDQSNYQITNKQWWVITIRWTKFVTDNDPELRATYLSEWEIQYKHWSTEFILDSVNNVLWIDLEQNVVDLFSYSNKLTSLYAYGVATDFVLNPVVEFTTELSKIKLKWKSYNYISSKNWFQQKNSYDLIDKTKQKILFIILDWYFKSDFAITLVTNRMNINDEFDSICLENWYKSMLSLTDAYKLLRLKSLLPNMIEFSTNLSLNKLFAGITDYIMIIWNHTDNDWNLTYLDIKDWQIKYTNISSNNPSDKRTWLILICK